MLIGDSIRAAIQQAIVGAAVEVTGDGRHFQLSVVSAAFEGKKPLNGIVWCSER